MEIFVGQNLLLVSFCYDNGKCIISIIGMKIFLRRNLSLVPFCETSEKIVCKYHWNENISQIEFVGCFFLL